MVFLLKISAVDRLPQILALSLWFTVAVLFVTLCTPTLSSLMALSADPITPVSSQPITAAPSDPIPVLAYYYIWFDTQSWDRAKTDYPLLGRYSSDDPDVMHQHVQWAKTVGIDGFIVSWKSTDKLNRRLNQLAEIADEENFKLAIIYQGLDFDRNPLPPEQVNADLNYFILHYIGHPAFVLFEKPLIIWSGTWKFSMEEIQSVVQDKRDLVFILASEKNVEGYQRLAGLVDGDAYYWSSVNPDTYPTYPEKLVAMGEAIHANGGLWIAPAAPGFDARLIGGTTVVGRKNGETLRIEMSAAFQSSPDAIGLISWNEFSENSHIEPSHNYGNRYLDVLSNIHQDAISRPALGDFDSSEPNGTFEYIDLGRIIALSTIVILILIRSLIIVRRDPRKG